MNTQIFAGFLSDFFSGEAEDRNEIHNIAKCLAELTFSWANSDQTRIEPVLEQMLKDSEHSEHEKVKQFSLLTLGELGRRVSLGPKVVQQQISQFKVRLMDPRTAWDRSIWTDWSMDP